MCEEINININETNETINIVSTEIVEVIDVNVGETVEEVTFNITEEIIQVNINKVTGGGGEQTLAETLVLGNNTGGTDILLNNDDAIQLENNSSIRKGTYDFGQGGGVSRICGVDYEDMWQGGIRHVFDNNGYIRNSTNGFNAVPNFSFDASLRFKVGSFWTLDDGTTYICTDATVGAAVWELYNVIPTNTSDLTNDGEDGVNPFITADDVPSQVNSDWNATSGVEEILNKPTIPTQTSDLTNNGADGTNPFITALDIPTTGQASTIVREVKNMTGATLTKGTVVYISGANGNKALVSKALATTDELSSRTFGLLQSNILNNGLGYCVIIGDLSGLNTSSFAEGAQLYLSGTVAGTYTATKVLAPTHLVYVGKVTRVHPTQGQIEVGIQNGYELAEIHDVSITSVADKQILSYDSATSLWKNKSVTTADIASSTNKNYVSDAQATVVGNTSGTNTGDETTATIKTKLGAANTSNDGYLTSENWNTFNNKLNGYLYKLSYPTATVTGTTSEVQVLQLTIPANTFSANDLLNFTSNFQKVGITGTIGIRVKISTSATMPSGTTGQIAVVTIGTASLYSNFERRLMMLSGGNIYSITNTTSAITDTGTNINAITSQTFDTTVTNYLYVSVTNSSSLDSTSLRGFKFSNI